VIEVKGLFASLGNRPVLRDIRISVRASEVVGLFGHNGAGKSTLLRCIVGRVPVSQGTVDLSFGAWRSDLRGLTQAGLRYLPQKDIVFSDMTVEENIRVFSDVIGLRSREFDGQYGAMVELFPILALARSSRAGALSGGERQQIAIARTFLGKPQLLLLDEPSIGLSAAVRETVFHLIRQAADKTGCAVLLAEHRVAESLDVCERVYVLRQGAVASTSAAVDLRSNQKKLLEAIL
jgi:branched-chain amino acid transport system ATP-binding protein